MSAQTTYLEFEVTLEGVDPPVWRRFLLRRTATFHELHDTIQKACSWLDYHLYSFNAKNGRDRIAISPVYNDGAWDEQDVYPAGPEVRIADYFRSVGDECVYEYDFGDGWLHRVVLIGVHRRAGTKRRVLLAGARAFPPEDCGGVSGYYECLEAFRITDDELARHDRKLRRMLRERRMWFGDWDPERFDLDCDARKMRRPVNDG